MSTVYIVGECNSTSKMYLEKGWELVEEMEEADVVHFIGGSDISPALYGETASPSTYTCPSKDRENLQAFIEAQQLGCLCVGVCAGAHYLNAMGGGSMHQDVDNHTSPHVLYDIELDEKVFVTSTHHQQMIEGEYGNVIATAGHLSTYREGGNMLHEDVEVVWYDWINSLCFQPHPEHVDVNNACQQYFFSLVEAKMWEQ